MQEMAVSTTMNGVDVNRLFETIEAIKGLGSIGSNRSLINDCQDVGLKA